MSDAMKALAEVERAIKALLCRDERNTCQHEETTRRGAIWEICSMCGAKWADDEGGKPEWEEPNEWSIAHNALSLLPTLRAALAPGADGEVEAIRQRHEHCDFVVTKTEWNERASFQAHTDRATLLAYVDRLSAELASARQAIKVQASAVKTLQAAEGSEVNVLRSKATEAHRAVVTLDSERAMNATLTEEVERLSAELAKERERRVEVEGALKPFAAMVSNHPEMDAPSPVITLTYNKAHLRRAATLTKDTP